MGYCYGWGGSGTSILGGFWWIMPLLFWGLIITGIILLFRVVKKRNSGNALNVLKEEYALGRMSREEFLTRKKDLQ